MLSLFRMRSLLPRSHSSWYSGVTEVLYISFASQPHRSPSFTRLLTRTAHTLTPIASCPCPAPGIRELAPSRDATITSLSKPRHAVTMSGTRNLRKWREMVNVGRKTMVVMRDGSTYPMRSSMRQKNLFLEKCVTTSDAWKKEDDDIVIKTDKISKKFEGLDFLA